MRYVATCSRTTCTAFARAEAYGNGKPANAPELNVVIVGCGEADRQEISDPASELSCCDEVLVGLGEVSLSSKCTREDVGVLCTTVGKCCSRIFVMDARCVPASTARMEFLDHFEAVARTSSPVTLFSFGPPPAPRHITWIAASFGGWSANPSPFFMAPACAGRAVTESRSSAGLRIVSGVYRVAAGTLQPKQHRVRVSRTAPSISICPSCQGAPLVARDELVGSEDGDGAGET